METVKTWKAQPTAKGVVLTLNGVSYLLGGSTDAIRFELEHAQEQAHELARQAAQVKHADDDVKNARGEFVPVALGKSPWHATAKKTKS